MPTPVGMLTRELGGGKLISRDRHFSLLALTRS